MQNLIRRKLKVDTRVAMQLSQSAIKKNPIIALVELITNSDDSYRRLDVSFGSIVIKVQRKNRNSIFTVIDNAEGMDRDKFDQVVGEFGTDSSGFTSGEDVRGYFGRGLKEAILGLGKGTLKSIKNNKFNECSLNEEADFELKPEKLASKKLRQNLGIMENGTCVEITITNQEIKIPQISTIIHDLSRYYSLRDINSSNSRSVRLINENSKEFVELEYEYPKRKELTNKENLPIAGYPSASFDIQVFIANEALTSTDFTRESGLLIKSKIGIHAISLFKFEHDPFAQKICGHVSCQYIDELLRNDEQVLSDKRDGLAKNHAFNNNFIKAIEDELTEVIEKLRKVDESKKKSIENKETLERIRKVIKEINDFALNELGFNEGSGTNKGDEKGKKKKTLPTDGFNFIPEFYEIEASKQSTLTLRGIIPYYIKDEDLIKLTIDTEEIKILNNQMIKVNEEESDENLIDFKIKVLGNSIGTEGFITASTENISAVACIKVVDKKERKKLKHKSSGLISDIKFDPELYERAKVRYFLDESISVLKIATTHPCVKKYLGPRGEGQSNEGAQVLIAELIVDSVCWKIARLKESKGDLMTLHTSQGTIDTLKREHDRLISEIAEKIHNTMVKQLNRELLRIVN